MNTDIALVVVFALGLVFWVLNRREEKKRPRPAVTEQKSPDEVSSSCPMLDRQHAGYIGIFSKRNE